MSEGQLYEHEKRFQAMRDAAPDLYEAVNRVADQLVSIEGRTKGDKLRLLDQIHVLRAAAAKARGEQ